MESLLGLHQTSKIKKTYQPTPFFFGSATRNTTFTSNSKIWNETQLEVHLTHLEESKACVLLGHSGYPLKTYLMTPKLQPSNQQEKRYNAAHMTRRVVVERAFGLLKSRFRCLHCSGGSLPFKPGKCARVTMASVRLHNLCIDRGIPVPAGDFTNDIADDQIVLQDGVCAHNVRDRIIGLF